LVAELQLRFLDRPEGPATEEAAPDGPGPDGPGPDGPGGPGRT
jgi:hypothetical protein